MKYVKPQNINEEIPKKATYSSGMSKFMLNNIEELPSGTLDDIGNSCQNRTKST